MDREAVIELMARTSLKDDGLDDPNEINLQYAREHQRKILEALEAAGQGVTPREPDVDQLWAASHFATLKEKARAMFDARPSRPQGEG